MELSQIWLYPIKSCAGVALEQAELEPMGLRGDRRWMLVDEEGTFLSQRALPAMATIRPELRDGGLVVRHGSSSLELRTPGADAGELEVRVWRDTVRARAAGDEADRWLRAILGREVRLVHLPDESVREVDQDYGRPGDRVSFADGFPLLLISEASLEALNARLEVALPMQRFRPNLVVRGCEPFAEDDWSTFEIGGLRLEGVKPCSRCSITTIDQERGVLAGPQPLRELSAFRRDATGSGKVYFGQNVIPRQAQGRLRLGMSVSVVR